VVWETFLPRFFGRLFNEIVPNANVFKSPKLKHQVTFMSYCRLAYPHFKEQLADAMVKARRDVEQPERFDYLEDLHDLLEFFIPVVCCLFIIAHVLFDVYPCLSHHSIIPLHNLTSNG
jgi:hypothetical protein